MWVDSSIWLFDSVGVKWPRTMISCSEGQDSGDSLGVFTHQLVMDMHSNILSKHRFYLGISS